MVTFGLRLGSFLLVTFAAALGCGSNGGGGGGGGLYQSIPEDSAERTFGRELCRLMLEQCDCPRSQELFGTLGECIDAAEDQLVMNFAAAKAAGLAYHPECMADHVNFYTQTVACTTQSELTNEILTQLNVPICKVHSGEGQAGDACMPYYEALGDDCAPGLQCQGTCTPLATLTDRAEGEACVLQTDRCEPGTACLSSAEDPTGPAACTRLPGEGQPCSVGCDVGLVCDFVDDGTERVCLPPPAEGQPCGSVPYECAAGLYCDGATAVCALTLAEGEPCADDQACGLGFECEALEDGGEDVCRPEDAFVCF
jgi:hypothetical protein